MVLVLFIQEVKTWQLTTEESQVFRAFPQFSRREQPLFRGRSLNFLLKNVNVPELGKRK